MAQSAGQPPRPGIRAGEPSRFADSLTTTTRFVQNAPALLDSLTALYFCRLRIASLEARLERTRQERNQLAGLSSNAFNNLLNGQEQLLESQAETARWRRKYQVANRERWGWRLGLGLVAGATIYATMP